MAKLFNGSINFPSTMTPTGAQPLDDRTVVQSLTDLFAADTFGTALYNGMLVAVVDEQRVFMLVDKTKKTSEEGWVAVGSGNGSIAVETYAEAVALATDDNIGQIIYVKTESEYDADGEGEGAAVTYDIAPYIVIGEGALMKLSTSSASGDIESDVAALLNKVANLENTVGNAESGLVKSVADNASAIEANATAITAEASARTEALAALESKLQDNIDEKVAQTVYDAKVKEIDDAIAAEASARTEALAALETKLQDNIDEKVAQSDYDAKVKEIDDAIAAEASARTEALAALETKLQDNIDEKVDAAEGYRLMANTEGTKLAGIEEGAEVNIIEVIKVNGTALTVADADKSVNITLPEIPVKGVDANEKLISLEEDGKLKSTLKIAYVPASKDENENHVPAKLVLQGKEDAVISSIDADQFVKDGMIESVKLVNPDTDKGETGTKYLEITWNVDAGSEVTRLDVSDLFNPYTASDGVALSGNTFSIKLATNEQYLTVGTDGLGVSTTLWDKVTEYDNAVLSAATENAATKAAAAEKAAKDHADAEVAKVKTYAEEQAALALTSAQTFATEKANAAQAAAEKVATDLNTAMTARVEALEDIDHDHENKDVLDGINADKVAAWDAAEKNAKDYADSTFVTKDGFNAFEQVFEDKLSGIAENAEVNVLTAVTVNGVQAVVNEDRVAEVEILASDIKLGEEVKTGEEVTYGTGETISSVLQSIHNAVVEARQGSIHEVVGEENIINVETSGNTATVSLVVEKSTTVTVAAGHIEIVKGDNGLFAQMYYDGDDAE